MGSVIYDTNVPCPGTHLEAGSEEEMEIRGCSIWAVEVGIDKKPNSTRSNKPHVMFSLAPILKGINLGKVSSLTMETSHCRY